MNNKDKAIALIKSFSTGDVNVANEVLVENYIQHNLAYETGKQAFIGAVGYLGSLEVKTTVENIRAFEDKDKVFLQTVYNFAGSGKQVAFDIFRFEDGLIVEHWDNLTQLAEVNPSGRTQIDGEMEVKDLNKTNENKELVNNFIKEILMNTKPEEITKYFDGDNYIQHNTQIADGLSGLGAALEHLAKSGIAMVYNKVHQILGEGNFVLSVSEGEFANQPTAYYDLFRIENGKIAEHWDVMETITKDVKNQNGKF